MNQLALIPRPGMPVAMDDLLKAEQFVAQQITAIDDLSTLQEWHDQAEALATYLQGKDLHGPMLGAQRRIEARIGQLLGDGRESQLSGKPSRYAENLSDEQRNHFRMLARGWGQLADNEWRQSRRALIDLIRERFPMPRRTPEVVVKKDGSTKKTHDVRVKEITGLAEEGYRAAQIAKELGIQEEQVRRVAKAANVRLPDAAIGKKRRIDPLRILSETINGVDAYISSPLLEEIELPELDLQQRQELMQALSRSINGLRKLPKPFGEVGEQEPALTLWIRGPSCRPWGFHCSFGWVHWRDFVAADDPGTVGKGCEQ